MKKLLVLMSFAFAYNFAFAQTYKWTSTFGTPNKLFNSVMVVDDQENTYVLAMYANSPGSGAGPQGSTLVKYTSVGNIAWKHDIPDLLNGKLAVDHKGNLIVAALDGPDYYLIRYNANGSEIKRTKALPSVNGVLLNKIEAISVDATNNYYITGGFAADFSFGSYSLTGDGNKRMYVAKFDASDNCNWLIGSDQGGVVMNHRVVADNNGNCYVSGLHSKSLVLQGKSINVASGTQPFVMRIKADGQVDWIKALPAISPDASVCDQKGNFVVAGQFATNLQLGPTSLTIATGDNSNGYLAKMDVYGNIIVASQFGGPDYDEVHSISSRDNNLYVFGDYKYQISMGNITVASSFTTGYTEPFVAQFDSYGHCDWATNTGCVEPGWGKSYAVGNIQDNNIYVVGQINGTMDFNGHPQSGAGEVFVAKLANNVVGVNERAGTESTFAIFPNPASNAINISSLIPAPSTLHVYVFDGQGRKVYSKEIKHTGGIFLEKTDISSLPPGSYVIELWQNNDRQASRQFIK
jgi:hypothetical protein